MDAEATKAQLKDTTQLKARKHLTLLFDGWEDKLQRSLYGTVAAELGEPLYVLSLDELTGSQGMAKKYLETMKGALKKMNLDDGKNFVSLTTDNPTVMQAYRQLMKNAYYWILVSSIVVLSPFQKLILILDLTMFSAWVEYYDQEIFFISSNEMCYLADCSHCELF
jgi:hypothetical protein